MGKHCLCLLYFYILLSHSPTKIEMGYGERWAFDLCHYRHFNEIQASELLIEDIFHFARLAYLG